MYSVLALKDGTVFEGKGFGAEKEVGGEVVFNTSLVENICSYRRNGIHSHGCPGPQQYKMDNKCGLCNYKEKQY